MRWYEPIRLRGTILAVFVLVAIAIIYSYLDTASSDSTPPEADVVGVASTLSTSTTIPITNRLCGLAQRAAADSANKNPIDTAKILQDFYRQASELADGPIRADLVAAQRWYADYNEIGARGSWDVEKIVRNNDGARWRQLISGSATGVNEARSDIQQLCRTPLPAPPLVAVDADGRISDPRLRVLLDPPDKEIPTTTEPPPSTTPAPTTAPTAATSPTTTRANATPAPTTTKPTATPAPATTSTTTAPTTTSG